jgi:hypothetical protein
MTEEPKMVKLGIHQLLEQVMAAAHVILPPLPSILHLPQLPPLLLTKLLDTKDCKDVLPIDWCHTFAPIHVMLHARTLKATMQSQFLQRRELIKSTSLRNLLTHKVYPIAIPVGNFCPPLSF